MDEVINAINEDKSKDISKVRIKKWDHLPIRPETFAEFHRLKNTTSDNAFVLELMRVYRLSNSKTQSTENVGGTK